MITYLKGDATNPIGTIEHKYIVHCCNDIGAWGKGFVLAISNKWKKPEREYRKWIKYDKPKLGEIQFVNVENKITVINMIGQEGIRRKNNKPPIRYSAIRIGFRKIAFNLTLRYAKHAKILVSIHMPKIGCGLAGGNWEIVKKIIEEELKDFNVYIYIL